LRYFIETSCIAAPLWGSRKSRKEMDVEGERMSEREGEGDRRKKGLKREGVRGGPREERVGR
jgi:hypothetical protein